MRALGYLLGIGSLLLGMFLGGEFDFFIDVPTLVIVPGGGIAFALAAHGKPLWRALAAGLFEMAVEADEEARLIQILQTLRTTLIGIGIAYAFLGGINISAGLDDWSSFGPGFAVLLLGPFYGVVLAELLVAPAMNRLELKLLS